MTLTIPRHAPLALLILLASPAFAQERDYCPERPGLDTPACTMAPGRVSVETGFADWTRGTQDGTRTDTVLAGDTLIRVGVSDTIEARVGWTPYGHVRTRDLATGAIDRTARVGDVTLGVKANLRDPDGTGVSVAVLPFATLPVGRAPVGTGEWGAGVLIPLTIEVSDRWSLDVTPEVDAAVDDDGHGRHLAYSGTAGLALAVSKALTLTGEGQVLRDRDPGGHSTQCLAALSLAWKADDDLQFDVLAAAGLNRSAPDVEVYAGISRRF